MSSRNKFYANLMSHIPSEYLVFSQFPCFGISLPFIINAVKPNANRVSRPKCRWPWVNLGRQKWKKRSDFWKELHVLCKFKQNKIIFIWLLSHFCFLFFEKLWEKAIWNKCSYYYAGICIRKVSPRFLWISCYAWMLKFPQIKISQENHCAAMCNANLLLYQLRKINNLYFWWNFKNT